MKQHPGEIFHNVSFGENVGSGSSREIRGNAVRNNVKNLAPGRLDAGSRAAQKKAPRERG
jgi:hypothetical protein